MKIQSITLSLVQIGQMCSMNMDGITHKKNLPYLSVVESLTGSYRVSIDHSVQYTAGNGGFFIAPSQLEQIITHCSDKSNHLFRARWLFLNATVNDIYPMESLYDFPVICPEEYREKLHKLMDDIFASQFEMDRYAKAMSIVSLLTEIGIPIQKPADEMIIVQQYLHAHYNSSVAVEDLTRLISVSQAKLFREFKATFGISPIAYLNRYRLGQSCLLLKKTERNISDIAFSVGFSDALYFSRLFKKEYGISPKQYRTGLDYF